MTNIVDTSTAVWSRAKKTAVIQAKHMTSLIADRSVVSKFLIDTLEGREPVSMETMFCIGLTVGDPWQQTPVKLLKKYTITDVTPDGWLVCTPKPENEVEFFFSIKDGYVQGHWGETIGTHVNLQRCKVGDAIARQTYDHTDQWVVHRTLFNATYDIL